MYQSILLCLSFSFIRLVYVLLSLMLPSFYIADASQRKVCEHNQRVTEYEEEAVIRINTSIIRQEATIRLLQKQSSESG